MVFFSTSSTFSIVLFFFPRTPALNMWNLRERIPRKTLTTLSWTCKAHYNCTDSISLHSFSISDWLLFKTCFRWQNLIWAFQIVQDCIRSSFFRWDDHPPGNKATGAILPKWCKFLKILKFLFLKACCMTNILYIARNFVREEIRAIFFWCIFCIPSILCLKLTRLIDIN